MSTIIDISIPLEESTTVYPGNPKVEFEKEFGKTSVHTKISLGSHTGTHLDAPGHVFENGISIDQMDLGKFYGECEVLDMTHASIKITKNDIIESEVDIENKRVLFKTSNSQRGFDEFYGDYVYLDGDAAEYLASKNVVLVGIDYLSIKQRGSDDNRPHTALLEKNIPILETINLDGVNQGTYTLSALPLNFKGIDGSPTRAVLIS